MKNNMKDLRGFTLIELLAVIVVLAIIMLIAVNAVLPQMEKARRSSFAIEANGAIEAAKSYFMNAALTGENGLPTLSGETKCVTIDDLIIGGYSDLDLGTYKGKVQVTKGSNIFDADREEEGYRDYSNMYFYKIWIRQGKKLMIVGEGQTTITDEGKTYPVSNVDINETHVKDYSDAWAYDSCS